MKKNKLLLRGVRYSKEKVAGTFCHQRALRVLRTKGVRHLFPLSAGSTENREKEKLVKIGGSRGFWKSALCIRLNRGVDFATRMVKLIQSEEEKVAGTFSPGKK